MGLNNFMRRSSVYDEARRNGVELKVISLGKSTEGYNLQFLIVDPRLGFTIKVPEHSAQAEFKKYCQEFYS